MDDRPFVLYALDQITRIGSTDGSETLRVRSYESTSSTTPSVVYPPAYLTKGRSWLRNGPPAGEPNHPKPDPKLKYTPKDSLASLALLDSGEEIYLAQDLPMRPGRNPPLDFLPMTLHHWSRNLLALCVLLMTTAILFCAEYSRRHNGLWEHSSPFDGRYVLFHYLFPIIAAGLYLWIQGLMAILHRIAPFMTMTSLNPKKRQEAIFKSLYPSSMLLPRLNYFRASQAVLGIISLLAFPVLFTIPLASSLFSVTLHDGIWRYSTSLPIAYLLASLYILVLMALFLFFIFFFRREHGTGLRFDPRSLADIISLLSRSNCMDDYAGSELLSRKDMKEALRDRSDRLGYWRTTKPTQEEFYGIGSEGAPARRYSIRDGYAFPHMRVRDSFDAEKGQDIDREEFRHAYVPWYLSRAAAIAWPFLFGALYIALLVVAFLPKTALSRGFPPGLNAKSGAAGFSHSNFAYSFIPSLLGLLLFLGMQKLFFTLARLYPWAELSEPGGETAARSLLVDYSASCTMPFGALLLAITNGHWLIALLSIMAPVSILLPTQAGGCFTTYTAQPSQLLLIFPHKSAFYTLIVILGLYLLTLVIVAIKVVGMGKRLRMPKPIKCLADLTSLLYASGVLGDAAFQGVYSRVDLRTRLLTSRERGGRPVKYFLGTFMGEDGERHLGIERVGRVVDGEKLRVRGKKRRRQMDGSWIKA